MRPALDNTVLRTFLPTKDFEVSKQFYELLGFAKVLDGEVAIYDTAEAGGIILQRYYQRGRRPKARLEGPKPRQAPRVRPRRRAARARFRAGGPCW